MSWNQLEKHEYLYNKLTYNTQNRQVELQADKIQDFFTVSCKSLLASEHVCADYSCGVFVYMPVCGCVCVCGCMPA